MRGPCAAAGYQLVSLRRRHQFHRDHDLGVLVPAVDTRVAQDRSQLAFDGNISQTDFYPGLAPSEENCFHLVYRLLLTVMHILV